MKGNLFDLTNEELKIILHKANFKFNQGIEKGLSLESLQKIRDEIKQITIEMERRNLARFSRQSNHPN